MGANFPVVMCFSSEIVASTYREIGPTIMITVAQVSTFLVSVLAYILLNAVGWRWFIIVVSLPIIPSLILLQFVPESPRVLCVRGDKKELGEAVKLFASLNKVQLPENISVRIYDNQVLGSISDLFRDKQTRRTTLTISTLYCSNMVLYFGLIVFLPLALHSNFCGDSTTKPPDKCAPLSQDTLANLSIITSATLIGIVSAYCLAMKLGRLCPLRTFSTSLFLVSLLLYR